MEKWAQRRKRQENSSNRRSHKHNKRRPPTKASKAILKLETLPACERTNKDCEEGHGGSCASDRTNKESTIKFEEGHGTSCASNKVKMKTSKFMEGTTNGKRDDSPRLDDSEADGPSRGKTKPNTYQTPSQMEHAWHKSNRDKKTSKHISERPQARKYVR